jgi:hypothetical protein
VLIGFENSASARPFLANLRGGLEALGWIDGRSSKLGRRSYLALFVDPKATSVSDEPQEEATGNRNVLAERNRNCRFLRIGSGLGYAK